MASVFAPQFLCASSAPERSWALNPSQITEADITDRSDSIGYRLGILHVDFTDRNTDELITILEALNLSNQMKHTLLKKVLANLNTELTSMQKSLLLTPESQNLAYKNAKENYEGKEEEFTKTPESFVTQHNSYIQNMMAPLEASKAKLEAALTNYPASATS